MNKAILALIVLLALVLFAAAIFSLSHKITSSPLPTSIPQQASTPQPSTPSGPRVDFSVQSVNPPQGTELTPANPLNISVTFSKPVTLSWIGVKLSSGLISSSKLASIQFKTSLSSDDKTLTISSDQSIAPLSQYALELTNLTTNTNLLTINYPSADTSPTPVPSNNPSLQSYLPYETTNYKLSYDPSRNVYVFNFKVDENSSVGIDDQYNQAKADATAFIQSKGIDPNSIAIEWRHS